MDVKSAIRTIGLFELFARIRQPLSLAAISRALDAPRSSCLYLIRSLEKHGYLYGVGSQQQIYPTQKLFDVAKAVASGGSWVTQVQPILERLRDRTNETVVLGKQQGSNVMYLAVYEGLQALRLSVHVGDTTPVHSTSIGKAILSTLEGTALTELISTMSLDAPARKSLLKELKKVSKDGYATTRGANTLELMALAKAITHDNDHFAVAIAGPRLRVTKSFESHRKHLFDACDQLEEALV